MTSSKAGGSGKRQNGRPGPGPPEHGVGSGEPKLAISRFGRVLNQTATAAINDMGVTSWIYPEQGCLFAS